MCPYTTILRSSSCNQASTCLMASVASPQDWCQKCTSMYKPGQTSNKAKLALDTRGSLLNFAAAKPFLPCKFLSNAIWRDSIVHGILFLFALIIEFKMLFGTKYYTFHVRLLWLHRRNCSHYTARKVKEENRVVKFKSSFI